MRFGNLERICEYLECQPGDLLEYQPDPGSVDHRGRGSLGLQREIIRPARKESDAYRRLSQSGRVCGDLTGA